MGGFARRASYIEDFKKTFPQTVSVLADAGNFSSDVGPEAAVRNRWVLEGMRRMGYAAVNVGVLEAIPETERWKELKEASDLPLVSANAIEPRTNRAVAPPYRLREVPLASGGRDRVLVGFLGLTDPAGEKLSLRFSDPIEAARKYVPELRGRCDLLVVLATMKIDRAKELVGKVSGIDVLLGSGEDRPQFAIESDALIAYPGEHGMLLGDLRFFFDESGRLDRYFHRLAPLSEQIADAPSFVEFQKKAEGEIREAAPR